MHKSLVLIIGKKGKQFNYLTKRLGNTQFLPTSCDFLNLFSSKGKLFANYLMRA